MRNDHYPLGTVQNILQTDFVLPQTKEVLQQRLNTPVVIEPSFFTKEEFVTLQVLCNCLLPQPSDRKNEIDTAGIFDTNSKEGKTGNGWRYDSMPPDATAYKQGLQAIEQSAQSQYGKAFQHLEERQQHKLITAVQEGTVDNDLWKNIPSQLFFKEIFSLLAEIYFSHPVGKEEIGEVSFADAKGWHNIQLNEREIQEPEIINENMQPR